jgi:heterodisulfide reductase subunit C
MNFKAFFQGDLDRREALAAAYVVPDKARCVQCGICSYNCPLGIDVRRHAWLGEPVRDRHCLTCGECINRCPRGVLRLELTHLFNEKSSQ